MNSFKTIEIASFFASKFRQKKALIEGTPISMPVRHANMRVYLRTYYKCVLACLLTEFVRR
jgi:hypothetical protein